MVLIDSVQHSVDGFRPPVGHSCSVPPEQQIPEAGMSHENVGGQ